MPLLDFSSRTFDLSFLKGVRHFFPLLCHVAYMILFPQQEFEPMPPALVGEIRLGSLNHWTARQVLLRLFLT